MWVRVSVAVIALAVIAGLGWQYFRSRPAAPLSESPPSARQSASDAESPQALFQEGNDYYKEGRYEDAIAAYKRAIELKPDYDAAYANLGAVYYTQQKLDLAEKAYLKAIELSPNDADVIYNLGAIYMQQALATGAPDPDKLNQALEQINRAIELNPKLAEPYYGLGVANQLMGKTDEAIEAFETFLELDDGSDPIATSNATKFLQELKGGQ